MVPFVNIWNADKLMEEAERDPSILSLAFPNVTFTPGTPFLIFVATKIADVAIGDKTFSISYLGGDGSSQMVDEMMTVARHIIMREGMMTAGFL